MVDIPVHESTAETLVTATAAGQEIFSFDFLVFTEDQTKVEYRPMTGTVRELVLNADYTVSGLNLPNGGSINLAGITVAVGDQLYIWRDTPIEREKDWQNEGDYKADLVNREQDEIYMIMQELRRGSINDNKEISDLWSALSEEERERIEKDNALASLIAQGGLIEVPVYDTRLAATLANIKSTINSIRTAGYASAGDGGGALYKRVVSEPTHAGKFQSADGAWWDIAETELDVRMFGAVADGTENSAQAINAALQAAATTGRSSVLVRGGGAFLCEGAINVPSYAQLIGDQKTIIKQADGSTLNSFINMASRSKLLRCVVDGNASNYAGPSQSVLVRIGDSHFVDVVGNNIGNAPDYCVAVNAGTYAKVQDNTLHDFKDHAVAVYGSNQSAYHTLTDNYIYNIGWAGFIIGNVSHCLVARNRIIGALMGGRSERMTVNSSGTTVTRVSGGASFENLRPGQFVVMNNGMEFRIQSITSSNTLETETPVPTLTGVQASCGTGDMIGVIASQFVTVEENIVVNCATFGMGASLGGNAVQCSNNVFRNNVIQNAGKNGINISYDGGTGYLANNRIEGNRIINPGYAGGIGATDRIAIMIYSTTAGKTINTYVGENTIVSFAGEGQVQHWLGCDAQIGPGQVKVGTVTLEGTPLSIFNAVESVTLTPSWGSGAAVSSVDYDLNHTTFNVTVGSGPTSDPMVTVLRRVVQANMKGDGFLAKIISTAGGGSMTAVLASENSDYAGHQRATLMMTPTTGNVFRMRFLT